MSDRAEVLAWLEESGRGYKAAAKKFGVDRDQVKAWASGTQPTTAKVSQGILGRLEQVALAGLAKKSAAGDTAASRALLAQVATQRGRARASAPAREAEQTHAEWLVAEVAILEADIETMRERQSWQAYSSAKRMVHKLKKEQHEQHEMSSPDEDFRSVAEVAEYLLASVPDTVWAHPLIQAKLASSD